LICVLQPGGEGRCSAQIHMAAVEERRIVFCRPSEDCPIPSDLGLEGGEDHIIPAGMADYEPPLGTAILHARRCIPDRGLYGVVGIIKALVNFQALGNGTVGAEGDIVGAKGQRLHLEVVVDQHEAEISTAAVR